MTLLVTADEPSIEAASAHLDEPNLAGPLWLLEGQ